VPPIASTLAAAIFVGSLVLLLVRPRRVPDWVAALGGGVLLVVLGVLPMHDAFEQLAASWNVFLFFLGLGLSAAAADQAGVFRAAAEAAARLSSGSQVRLFTSVYLAGAVVTAVLSNDATALLLTPVAFAVAARLGLDTHARMPSRVRWSPTQRHSYYQSPTRPTCWCSRARRFRLGRS